LHLAVVGRIGKPARRRSIAVLDKVDGLCLILALLDGVVTGAAHGYAGWPGSSRQGGPQAKP